MIINSEPGKCSSVRKPFFSLIAALIIIILSGCAAGFSDKQTLAFVDGEPVTSKDLEYSLEVAHRREKLSTARQLDISLYIQKLIDDRLIVQEARRMGMDEYPDVRGKIDAYIVRESVVMLYSEEVLSKVVVTDEEIDQYYRANYERLHIDIIEVGRQEEAASILTKLKEGSPFEEFSRNYPSSFSKKEGNSYIFTRASLTPFMTEALEGLDPGEFSDVKSIQGKHYIFKLNSRESAPEEELPNVKSNVAEVLRKQKIKKRENEYLDQIQRKSNITIHQERIDAIHFGSENEERTKWLKDDRAVLEVNGENLSVGEFSAMLTSSEKITKERTLKKWLDRKLVDQEALSRRYAEKPELKEKLNIYENQVIRNAFSNNVIASKIIVTHEDGKEYYARNQDLYKMPVQYRIQQISLDSKEDAEEVLKSLNEGANFSWLARTKSGDSFAEMDGVVGWKVRESLEPPVRDIIDSLESGEFSPPLQIDGYFRIVRLMEKTEPETLPFDRVKENASTALFKEKFREVYDEYVNELRQKAVIEINNDAVRSYETLFKE